MTKRRNEDIQDERDLDLDEGQEFDNGDEADSIDADEEADLEFDDLVNALAEAADQDPRTHRFGLFFVDDSGFGAFSWFATREELSDALGEAAKYFASFQFEWSGLKWKGELEELLSGETDNEFIEMLRDEFHESHKRKPSVSEIAEAEVNEFIEFLENYGH
jgi:hypothetical protein